MYKLQNSEETPDHKILFGEWGQIPPGWRELTAEEFSQEAILTVYSPIGMEYRQFRFEGTTISTHLYIMHDRTGWALLISSMKKSIRFFRFGCKHVFKETSRPAGNRSGMHTTKCTICDYATAYDTSD